MRHRLLELVTLQVPVAPVVRDSIAKATSKMPLINISLPQGSLPLPVLLLLLFGFFAIIIVLIFKAKGFKAYALEFPTHAATVIVALGLLVITIPVFLSLIALGIDLPSGAGDILTAECALAGVTVVGLGVKRFSSAEYMTNKAQVEAAKAGAAPPPVTVDAANVNITQERPAPAKPAAPPGAPPPPFKPIDFGPVSDVTGDSEGAVG